MRGFAVVIVGIMLLAAGWNKYITHGGLVAYYDRHPKASSAPMVLTTLGKGYEIVSGYDKMLEVYTRVVDRYPSSPYALDALFGIGLAYERLNRYPQAIEAYQKFIEKYPNSKYARSVRNNIEILKSR